ncbi:hypothetical protein ACTI_37840 [Actinoplanes sp. OR16]|uniref:hypothetical protein n=1 Tax=Actinoplanes sp. OR16 TaxID=946334 RepID=UPI000F704014|nr:hypothetical protein [Actinoplanes sp. OR16]BBH67099.1 hypothetical protein ACTI_37840 [Actinoplanes sp. OR16]
MPSLLCNPFFPAGCAIEWATKGSENVATGIVGTVLDGIAAAVKQAIEFVVMILASWTLIPSNDLCKTGGTRDNAATWGDDWIQNCNQASAGPAQELRGYMLPLTLIVLVGGLIWQGITVVISRKGEGFMQAVRGVWNTALWGAIGVAGTHLMLKAGDSYSTWLLAEAVMRENGKSASDGLAVAMTGLMVPAAPVAPILMILIGIVMVFAVLTQIILMIFREGAIVILAGLLQFAAAGTVTRTTSAWFQKTLGWTIALAAYKPAAVSVYAVAIMMMRGNSRDWLMGLGMVVMSMVALPMLMKFFTIFTGQVGGGGGGGGLMGAAAAGMHGASSLRGAGGGGGGGGNSAGDHARYMDSQGPGSGGGSPTGAATTPPTGAAQGASGGISTSGGTAGAAAGTGGAGAGAAGAGAGAAGAGAGAGAAGAGAAGAGAGAAGAAGAGAAGAGAAGAAAATGPAAPVALVAIKGAEVAVGAVKSAAENAQSAMDEGTSR